MRKPQVITIFAAGLLTAGIFLFGRTVGHKEHLAPVTHAANDGHDHSSAKTVISTDTILNLAKSKLSPAQLVRINTLEYSVSRGDVKDQQLHVYHQLARFWRDSARSFEPYAWFTAEAARLENSEKNLTFAAQLFLDNLQLDNEATRIRWRASQARDLFERSLIINPNNDSAQVGLGAAYLFGDISEIPMEGINRIRAVVQKDSTNVYAQMMLVKGSILSGQYDKAITRLQSIQRMKPGDLDALILLAEMNERLGKRSEAIAWYKKCLDYTTDAGLEQAIRERLKELSK